MVVRGDRRHPPVGRHFDAAGVPSLVARHFVAERYQRLDLSKS